MESKSTELHFYHISIVIIPSTVRYVLLYFSVINGKKCTQFIQKLMAA